MNANPLHTNCRSCRACGYKTFDEAEYYKHVVEHIKHIAEVRAACQFSKTTDEHILKWVSYFVEPNEIGNILLIVGDVI
jgi:hypothetical protein